MVTRETAKSSASLQLTRQSRTGSMRAADDLVAQEQVDPLRLAAIRRENRPCLLHLTPSRSPARHGFRNAYGIPQKQECKYLVSSDLRKMSFFIAI